MNKATTHQSSEFRLVSRPTGIGEGRGGKNMLSEFRLGRFIHWSRRYVMHSRFFAPMEQCTAPEGVLDQGTQYSNIQYVPASLPINHSVQVADMLLQYTRPQVDRVISSRVCQGRRGGKRK